MKDLNLILKELPYETYSLFSGEELSSLKRPIVEVTRILYHRNLGELLRVHESKNIGKHNKNAIYERTRHQIAKIVNEVLNELITN